MGYELSPTDLQEMLHGEKVTSSEKVLTWKKDGKETTTRGRLLLTEEYKVRIAPKLKSKQTTHEACPKCKTGKLQLITAIDGSKWYGCSGYPHCRFTKTFIPHTFQNALLKKDNGESKAGNKKSGKSDSGSGQSQSATFRVKKFPQHREQLSEAKKPNLPGNDSDVVAPLEGVAIKERPNTVAEGTTTPAAVISEVPCGNRAAASNPNRYQRIPKFILRMLKLDRAPSVKSSDAPSLS